MGWSRKETIRFLIITLISSFMFAVLAIALIVFNLLKKDSSSQYSRSFTYLIATTFGTGFGCIWFRISQAKKTWSHAIIHSLSLICMLFGHRDIFRLLIDGEILKCYNHYPISMLTIGIYIIQYLLSFHFVVFRYGRTPRQKAFRSGLHAFIGALTLFVCITDGVLVCHKMSRDENLKNELTFHLAAICIFLYGVSVWYMILNPYFDWRRLSSMLRYRTSKVSFSERNSPSRRIY